MNLAGKKILIVSDTHGRIGNYKDVIRKVSPVDMLIHCGDVEGQEEEIKSLAGCESHIVAGNNDYFSTLPREEEFEIGPYKVFLTHGHSYGVSVGTERIIEEAESRGVDVVIFGHTHKPLNEKVGDLRVLNPGSLAYPRQEGRDPSFMLMEFDQNGKMFCGVSYL